MGMYDHSEYLKHLNDNGFGTNDHLNVAGGSGTPILPSQPHATIQQFDAIGLREIVVASVQANAISFYFNLINNPDGGAIGLICNSFIQGFKEEHRIQAARFVGEFMLSYMLENGFPIEDIISRAIAAEYPSPIARKNYAAGT